jgi:hypothetical protein
MFVELTFEEVNALEALELLRSYDKHASRVNENENVTENESIMKILTECTGCFTDENWFKAWFCKDCGKKFKLKGSLKRHSMIHAGKRNYVCIECGKSFLLLGHLTRHERIHSGLKPYKCTHYNCGESFMYYGTFKKHCKKHERAFNVKKI